MELEKSLIPGTDLQAGHAPTVRQASAVSIVCATGIIREPRRPGAGWEKARARACERSLRCARLLRLGNPTYTRLRRANSTARAPVKGISQCVVWAGVSKRGLELFVFQDMRSHTRIALADTYTGVARVRVYVCTCAWAYVRGYISPGRGVQVHRTQHRKSLPRERIPDDAIKEKSESRRWINGRTEERWDMKGYVLRNIWSVLTRDSGCFRQGALHGFERHDSRIDMLKPVYSSLMHVNFKN